MSSFEVLNTVFQIRLPIAARAVDAAENVSVCFDAVSYNPATAMGAHRCQRVNRALEAVKRVVFPRNDYVESFVIFVFTNFASSHTKISRAVTFVAVFG